MAQDSDTNQIIAEYKTAVPCQALVAARGEATRAETAAGQENMFRLALPCVKCT